jgi:NAD(P) transhydrogenase subunit beta
MTEGIITVAYIAASILFILALGGLSHPESSRRGNIYGMTGMVIAILATVLGAQVTGYSTILVCMLIGGAIGALLAKRVAMTQMPELVAMLHSFVGLAAVLAHKIEITGQAIAVIATGGNVDATQFAAILAASQSPK